MSIYIDERTMNDLAKTSEAGAELERDEGEEESELTEDTYINNAPKPPVAKKQVTVKNVSMKECLRLATVDNFQGEEAEVMIISTVRCNKNGKVGFLKVTNRINVMMSRAKHGMYIFGSDETISGSNTAEVFKHMLEELKDNNNFGSYLPLKCAQHTTVLKITEPGEFERLVPDGGCTLPCGKRLLCGHECPRLCHPDDLNHMGTKCMQMCVRLHRPCLHPCKNLCYQDCGKCIERKLPCGHTAQSVSCFQTLEPETITCRVLVQAVYPLCGHKCQISCSQVKLLSERIATLQQGVIVNNDRNDILFSCKERCNTGLPCTHACERSCGNCCAKTSAGMLTLSLSVMQRTQHDGTCTAKCNRALLCGHSCKGVCHAATECPPCQQDCSVSCPHTRCGRKCDLPCPSCSQPCVWKCEHVGACPLPCGSPCARLPCNQRCSKVLVCEHRCPSVCGEVCPSPDECCGVCAPPQRKSAVVDFIDIH